MEISYYMMDDMNICVIEIYSVAVNAYSHIIYMKDGVFHFHFLLLFFLYLSKLNICHEAELFRFLNVALNVL